MNEVLKPDLVWIEGRCYRVTDSLTEVSAPQEHDLYENEIAYKEDEDEKDDFDDCEILQLDNKRYYTNFHIAAHYLGSIKGKKGSMKIRIESDTRTEIRIPRVGENKDIFIYAANPGNIKAARRRINTIVVAARMKYKPTHFLSIPMNSPDIMRKYENFKARVLKECTGRGLEDSLFIRPEKLHLTLGVTCLMDNEERLHASKLLTEAKTAVVMDFYILTPSVENLLTRLHLSPKSNGPLFGCNSLPLIQDYLPLKIRLKGLSYMNDDPKEINVLYGLVQEEEAPMGLLQNVIDSLVEHFKREGLMKETHERDNVKLHVTFLNSRYRTQIASIDNEKQPKSAQNLRETFDGTDIFEKFSNYDFGVMELREIHLSQRKTMGSDGYYQSTCIISCN